MITVKELSDLILRTLLTAYPEKAQALMPRESVIVHVAETILDGHVVIPKENYKNYEQWMYWMDNADKRWEQLVEFSKSIDERWSVIAAAISMLDVPRRELKHSKTGKKQRIKIEVVDDEENTSEPEPPLHYSITQPNGAVVEVDSVAMFDSEKKKKENQQ